MTHTQRALALILFLAFAFQVAGAQQFWEKKPYKDWSNKEVTQLLRESPWTRTVTISTTNLGLTGGTRRPSKGADLSEDVQPRIDYVAQFRSATPIRQAVARKTLLDAKYDSLDAAHKADLDKKIEAYLATSFADSVVLQVFYTSNSTNMLSDVRRYWIGQNVAQLQSIMFLNAGGQKLPVTTFVSAEGMFQISFARPKNLTATDNLSLEFQQPQILTPMISEQRVVLQFKPKDMVVGGAVQY